MNILGENILGMENYWLSH